MTEIVDCFGIPLREGDLIFNAGDWAIASFVGPLEPKYPNVCNIVIKYRNGATSSEPASSRWFVNCEQMRGKEEYNHTSVKRHGLGTKTGDYVFCTDYKVRKVTSDGKRLSLEDGASLRYSSLFTEQHIWNLENYPELFV